MTVFPKKVIFGMQAAAVQAITILSVEKGWKKENELKSKHDKYL